METMNSIDQDFWAEYEQTQGIIDAEREEQEELAQINSMLGGWDDECWDDNPMEWK